jgi:ribonuclease P protein component
VGFTVGKSVGGATTRNLVKRRLRAGLRGLLQAQALPSGTYVIGAGADIVSLTWPELRALLSDAVEAASRGTAA